MLPSSSSLVLFRVVICVSGECSRQSGTSGSSSDVFTDNIVLAQSPHSQISTPLPGSLDSSPKFLRGVIENAVVTVDTAVVPVISGVSLIPGSPSSMASSAALVSGIEANVANLVHVVNLVLSSAVIADVSSQLEPPVRNVISALNDIMTTTALLTRHQIVAINTSLNMLQRVLRPNKETSPAALILVLASMKPLSPAISNAVPMLGPSGPAFSLAQALA
ncbi:unnamed protein product [Mycena citricolor]|uniref:Secreted protein n=1 Tax=Mycena citricolor TaxID=2018698 RepID=A0AAD2GVG8_9AGAR|nr:unnamed protein product [Mycena citricolor]